MIHLLNGNKTERQRNSEGCTVYPCGCAHTDVLWLQMCDTDYQPTFALRERARIDHESNNRERTLREELA